MSFDNWYWKTVRETRSYLEEHEPDVLGVTPEEDQELKSSLTDEQKEMLNEYYVGVDSVTVKKRDQVWVEDWRQI